MTTDARGGRLEARPRIVAMPGPTGRPHVFVSHGRRDEVLPVASCGRRVVQRLRGAGVAPDVGNAARADAHVPASRPGAG